LLVNTESGVARRFTFRDLLVLRIVKSLSANGVSMRRARRQLRELSRRLPPGTSLAELSITASGGHVVVRDESRAWRADTGQLLLDLDLDAEPGAGNVEPPGGQLQAIPLRREAPAPAPVSSPTADEWFERAVDLEETDPVAAISAYKRALRLRPDCTETLINLGRLYAETGDSEQASEAFERALEHDPVDATAHYNLGVVAQDDGRDEDAISRYRRALELDPSLAEAHYNLATIFDRVGDPRAAIRHINEYRKLTRNAE
jgi:tetratricopeptide (TPR) repeat protein